MPSLTKILIVLDASFEAFVLADSLANSESAINDGVWLCDRLDSNGPLDFEEGCVPNNGDG